MAPGARKTAAAIRARAGPTFKLAIGRAPGPVVPASKLPVRAGPFRAARPNPATPESIDVTQLERSPPNARRAAARTTQSTVCEAHVPAGPRHAQPMGAHAQPMGAHAPPSAISKASAERARLSALGLILRRVSYSSIKMYSTGQVRSTRTSVTFPLGPPPGFGSNSSKCTS